MRFKHHVRSSEMPQLNLIPMMDVLMTILTFFVVISMTLSGERLFRVNLPEGNGGRNSNQTAETLSIGLDAQGQILIKDQPISEAELATAMQEFLTENPEGVVTLKADRGLTYEQVVQLLRQMRDIGGSRVSLAFDRSSGN